MTRTDTVMEADAETPEVTSRRRRAEMMLLVVTLIWGATFGTTKLLLESSLLPIGLLLWRFGIAAIIFVILFRRQLLREPLQPRIVARGLLLGLFLYAGFAFQTLGLDLTTSSRVGFITAFYVIFTPLLQTLITRRLPGWNVLLGVMLVLLGLWGLTAPGGTLDGLFEPWREGGFGAGDALTVACALVFAGYIILLDRFARQGAIVQLTAMQLCTMACLSAAHCLLVEPWSMPADAVDWGNLLFLAIFATVLSTYWQTLYQRHTTPSRAAVIYTMESVFGAIFAWLVLDERLGPVALAGGGLIVVGLLATELKGGMGRKGDG